MFARAKAARQRGPTKVGRCCRAALIALFSTATCSQAAPPDIDSISPLAIRRGVPTEITLSGSDLSEATQLWTSFPARLERVGEACFRITTDAPVGLGALRAFGSNGVSNFSFIMLDDLPTAAESKTNKTRAAAQSVEVGGAIDGRCDELGYDWFKLRANKGQQVSVETVAARIGSKLDSVLRVMNAAGHELARNDDAPGRSGDSYLNFTAPATGDYFIEVRDVNYGGGSSFFYRLRLGGSPLTSFTFLTSEPNASHVANEREPNDTAAKATKVSLTNSVAGRFDKAEDRDCYEFTARKGERLEFRAATRSLGSACDAILQLDSIDGNRLARSNPSAVDEGVLTYLFASNGTYRLTVEEATGAFGSNLFYQISAKPAAGFSLSLDTDRVNVAPGKSFELKVAIMQGDHKGAVVLGLADLPETFVLTNNIIANGKSNVTMRVTAPDTLAPGTWQSFSIVGSAKRDGRQVQVRASTAPALRRQLPQRIYPPPELDGKVVLGVTTR
jgi:hypothetical protein